jgi:hypothetical protein
MKHQKSGIVVLSGIFASVIVASILIFSGCTKDSVTSPSSSGPNVNMAVSFSASRSVGVMKTAGALGVDSIRIDSAVVIFSRITFKSHIDSVVIDTSGEGIDSLDHDQRFVFKGPFVIHVQDTVVINFANQVLPPGTYDGIVLSTHRLRDGEHHQDCDKDRRDFVANDSSVVGSSITVWGAVYKNGAWTNFTFNFNDELKVKIKGNFIVPDTTSSVNIALNFNMGSWFTSPLDGSILDPTDVSFGNRQLIRRAIDASFGNGCGGRDRGDGHPERGH